MNKEEYKALKRRYLKEQDRLSNRILYFIGAFAGLLILSTQSFIPKFLHYGLEAGAVSALVIMFWESMHEDQDIARQLDDWVNSVIEAQP
jgi:hypothetical protein